MEILIKEVKYSARDPYTNKTYHYWITGLLKSGREIKIFDFEEFDLRNYTNRNINCLVFGIVAQYDVSSNFTRIKGKYIEKYQIPKTWYKCDWTLESADYSAIQTQDGTILIDPIILDHHTIDFDDNLIVDIVRLDLFGWLPIGE